MFDDIKNDVTRKFREAKMWLTDIEQLDVNNVIVRGLFFVYIYGIFEETTRQVVYETISALNHANVKMDECIFELYSLILSRDYDALYNVGNEHKWEKRWSISAKMAANDIIEIPHEIMPTDGKNIRYKQLESIAKSFGMKTSILPRNELGGYLKEMVDNRNAIAHGNKTPKEVGRDYTIQDLKKRCDSIEEICDYIILVYETYINDKEYLRIHI